MCLYVDGGMQPTVETKIRLDPVPRATLSRIIVIEPNHGKLVIRIRTYERTYERT